MRWKEKPRCLPPELGETRVVKKFLLLPLKIGNETRWLEEAKIKQEWQQDVNCGVSSEVNSRAFCSWVDVAWIDDS